ncbi:MAG: hypothetical protein OXF51_09905 [Alphaproteobacteria bacterium]|nr:hypothetical protein [Alphaproteobacteria bacterium]
MQHEFATRVAALPEVKVGRSKVPVATESFKRSLEGLENLYVNLPFVTFPNEAGPHRAGLAPDGSPLSAKVAL